MPPDDANSAACISLCRGLRSTSNTSSRAVCMELGNLAWACPSCNLHKSNRVEVESPDVCEAVPLFNPRTDRWNDHFCWDGYYITGLTPIGRATVDALC